MRRKIRTLFLVDGLRKLMFIFIIVIAGFCGLDYLVHGLQSSFPQAIRLINLSFWTVAFMVLVGRFIIYPASKRITDDDLALKVEKKFPQLRDSLISAIQFERAIASFDPSLESKQLMDRVIADGAKEAGNIPLGQIVRAQGKVVSKFIIVIALFTGYCYLLVEDLKVGAAEVPGAFVESVSRQLDLPEGAQQTNPNYTRIGLLRFLGFDVEWPRETFISLKFEPPVRTAGERGQVENFSVDEENRKVICAQGSRLRFEVEVRSVRALSNSAKRRTEATLHVSIEGKEEELISMQRVEREGAYAAEKNTLWFEYRFESLLSDRSFYVTSRDGISEEWNIEILPPPRLDSVVVTYEFAPYLEREAETRENWTIAAPIGTRVSLQVVTNKPITKEKSPAGLGFPNISFGDDGPIELEPLNAERTKFALREPFTVWESEEYFIALVDEYGLQNSREPHSIVASRDEAPRINLSECYFGETLPGDSTVIYLTQRARVPLTISASDDLGIKIVNLFTRREGEAEVRIEEFTHTFGGEVKFPTELIVDDFVLRAGRLVDDQGRPLSILDEDRMTLYLRPEVTDNFLPFDEAGQADQREGGGKATIDPVRYVITTNEEALSRVWEAIMSLKETIVELSSQEDHVYEVVQAARGVFDEKGAIVDEDYISVRNARSTQGHIVRRAGNDYALKRFESIQRIYDYNDLEFDDPDRTATKRLTLLIEKLTQLAGTEESCAVKAYDFLRDVLSSKSTQSEVDLALIEAEKELVKSKNLFAAILDLLDEWQSFGEIEQLLREIIRSQRAVNQRIQEMRGR
ncbi:MAG: hypothetical protein NUW37_14910 [Planctomycetes bacterium]|nr:hypothetical protein [Planctomycetota bacterium]